MVTACCFDLLFIARNDVSDLRIYLFPFSMHLYLNLFSDCHCLCLYPHVDQQRLNLNASMHSATCLTCSTCIMHFINLVSENTEWSLIWFLLCLLSTLFWKHGLLIFTISLTDYSTFRLKATLLILVSSGLWRGSLRLEQVASLFQGWCNRSRLHLHLQAIHSPNELNQQVFWSMGNPHRENKQLLTESSPVGSQVSTHNPLVRRPCQPLHCSAAIAAEYPTAGCLWES